ncbi:MAG TPA: hypothetical protein VLB80_03615 [Candidatus Babeliales bacterium]|nr:hypothetical protein [Candidatus Babeliales bacterium]
MTIKTGKMSVIFTLTLLSCCSRNIIATKHDNFVASMCATIGLAVCATTGILTIADWYCSETDTQMMSRIDSECRVINSQYYDTMSHFLRVSGMHNYVFVTHKPYNIISEAVLFEFATHIWNSHSSQHAYRTQLCSAKNTLKSDTQSLRKRIHTLEGKYSAQEDQQTLHSMRKLLHDAQELSSHITLFADCLEHHKSYFNLYDSVDIVRKRYMQELTIFESGRYSAPNEIKHHILNFYTGRYAFCAFVNAIEQDIATLYSSMQALVYAYDTSRQYVNGLIYYLNEIKNIVVIDPRYQQELYEWKQDRLQQIHIEAMQAQARFERNHITITCQ